MPAAELRPGFFLRFQKPEESAEQASVKQHSYAVIGESRLAGRRAGPDRRRFVAAARDFLFERGRQAAQVRGLIPRHVQRGVAAGISMTERASLPRVGGIVQQAKPARSEQCADLMFLFYEGQVGNSPREVLHGEQLPFAL